MAWIIYGCLCLLAIAIYVNFTRNIPSRLDKTQAPKSQSGLTSVCDYGAQDVADGVDIVFVHGLGSNPDTTWQATRSTSDPETVNDNDRSVNWVRDFLADDLSHEIKGDTRLYFYNYDSYWKRDAITTNLQSLARGLLLACGTESWLGLKTKNRATVFVAYSYGGLVVKEALVQASQEADYKGLIQRTRAVLFLGTPHRGSDFGYWGHLMARLLRPLGSNSSIFDEIQYDSESLRMLHGKFMKIFRDDESDWQLEYTNGEILSSACFELADNNPLPTDHCGLNKFDSKSAVYLCIKDVLVECINRPNRLREQQLSRLRVEVINRLASHVVKGAAHDSLAEQHNPQCLEGTRTEVLRDIIEWVRDPSSKAVYWLNGMAGTGKSTITRTVANICSEQDDLQSRLGATFFFKRGEGDRGNMSKFFTTITSQLVQQLPEIAEHVQAAIEADPALFSKAMRTQFEMLIMKPVSNISTDSPCRILLLVIDALDECEREDDVGLLIELLSGVPRALGLQVKFFLTSRPELPIRLGFNKMNGTYRDFILHEVAEPVIEHDLAVYLKHELERTRLLFNQGLPEERKLPANWPSPTDIASLVQMAIPLFIFAATTCRFVADRRIGNPGKKLQRVLEFRSAQAPKLMATYMPVLEQLTIDLAEEERNETLSQFQRIVGPIVILADPLGFKALSQLLDIATDEILELLDFLHSVLQVPSLPEQPIRLLHLSFRDFLVDPKRQGSPFWVNERMVHQQLAEQCLRILNSSLANDICNVKAPGTLASSMSASEVKTYISPELQYACRFWTYHLCESLASDSDTASIWSFLSLHFLQWLEVLSWIGRLPESLGMVQSLQSKIPEDCQNINDFLSDSVRFIQAMGTNIQNAPLQTYSSALENFSRYIDLEPQMPLFWGERQRTLEGHTGHVNSVAFSPDGQQIASASGDQTVVLWSAATGERQATLEGHTDHVNSVVFSPDGQQIASASDDQTVILWSAATGEKRRVLQSGFVTYLSFTSDGTHIVSDRGRWDITSRDRELLVELSPSRPDDANSCGCAISSDNCWVMRDGQHILRLPVEYRPVKSAISGKSIVWGCSSGMVLILRII